MAEIEPAENAEGSAGAFLRQHDPLRFIADLFAREPARSRLFALHAFAAEIAAIPERVREPMAGEVRLQWWREAIDRKDPAGHPLAAALLRAATAAGLPDEPLLRILEA